MSQVKFVHTTQKTFAYSSYQFNTIQDFMNATDKRAIFDAETREPGTIICCDDTGNMFRIQDDKQITQLSSVTPGEVMIPYCKFNTCSIYTGAGIYRVQSPYQTVSIDPDATYMIYMIVNGELYKSKLEFTLVNGSYYSAGTILDEIDSNGNLSTSAPYSICVDVVSANVINIEIYEDSGEVCLEWDISNSIIFQVFNQEIGSLYSSNKPHGLYKILVQASSGYYISTGFVTLEATESGTYVYSTPMIATTTNGFSLILAKLQYDGITEKITSQSIVLATSPSTTATLYQCNLRYVKIR